MCVCGWVRSEGEKYVCKEGCEGQTYVSLCVCVCLLGERDQGVYLVFMGTSKLGCGVGGHVPVLHTQCA